MNRRPLTILQMTHQGDFGGSTNSITWLTGGLAERGHSVHLCCRKESLLFERFGSHPSVQLIPFDFGRSPIAFGRSLRIAQMANRIGADIVNAHASVDRHLSIQARRLFGGKFQLVHTRRNMPLSSGGKVQGQYFAFGTDRLIAVSGAVADGMAAGGVPRDHISVVHNGLPLERYQEVSDDDVDSARESVGLEKGEPVIGVVARKKSQAELMRAMKGVEHAATILLMGIDFDEELEALRKEIALPNRVVYGGFRHDIIPYYRLMTLFVLPSIIEGFSLSILEAMALGLPVVCTAAGGNPEAVADGENGFLFEPGDQEKLGRSINALLADADLRKRMGSQNRSRVFDTFSVKNTVIQAEKVYHSLVESGS